MMMLFQYKEEYLFITFGSKSNLVYLCPEVWSWDLCDILSTSISASMQTFF